MNFHIKKLSSKQWAELSEKAHIVSFGIARDFSLDRIDFALISEKEDGELAGFLTCKEIDSETIYIQHGGSFLSKENKLYVTKAYFQGISSLKKYYKRIETKILNTNIAMIKLALQFGFLITGTFLFKDKLYLQLLLEET